MQPRATIFATDIGTVNVYITLNKSQVTALAYLWSLDSSLHPEACPLAFFLKASPFILIQVFCSLLCFLILLKPSESACKNVISSLID